MTPPRDLWDDAAERGILGVILLRNAALDDVIDVLEPDHFGRDHHRRLFAAMRALHAAGAPIDPITLVAQLERAGEVEAHLKAYAFQLGDGAARGANVRAYADVIRDKALLRDIRQLAQRALDEAAREEQSGRHLLEALEQDVYKLSQTAVKSDWVSGAELAAELYPVIERLSMDGSPVTGLTCGFQDLDNMTRGFQDGDLVLVGARPSMGKTAFALQVALHAAQTVPVAFLSVEMSRQPLGLRGVIAGAQVDGWRMLSGRLTEADMRRVSDGLSALGQAQIYIDESPTLSPVHVRAKLRRLRTRTGRIGLVVIDYLQLMAALPEHRQENKTNQVAGISRALKILAREFAVPFLVLSQLNRGLERTGDKRPSMADLRDSGSLEQDADLVLLLHRPEVYKPKPELAGVAELIVAKQRNGPIGTVGLTWRAEQMRFENRSYRA